MNADEYREAFLKANANVEYMSSVLADVLRDCLRAIAANDHSIPVSRATGHFRSLLDLFRHAESFRPYELIGKAVEDLRVEPYDDPVDRAVIHAAEMGMRLLVERSASDGAAKSRASSREREFLQAIRDIDDARQVRAGKSPRGW